MRKIKLNSKIARGKTKLNEGIITTSALHPQMQMTDLVSEQLRNKYMRMGRGDQQRYKALIRKEVDLYYHC